MGGGGGGGERVEGHKTDASRNNINTGLAHRDPDAGSFDVRRELAGCYVAELGRNRAQNKDPVSSTRFGLLVLP